MTIAFYQVSLNVITIYRQKRDQKYPALAKEKSKMGRPFRGHDVHSLLNQKQYCL